MIHAIAEIELTADHESDREKTATDAAPHCEPRVASMQYTRPAGCDGGWTAD